MLWETVASNGRERSSKAINIAADSFSAVIQHEVGTSFALKLSPHVPTLQASVANRNTHSDGTIVTNLTIQGSPSGQLSIQENASMDFFLAQLYFENHPVAYQFQKSADGIIETTGDADVFSFSTVGGACSFSASGDATSQNVDVQLEILDASGAVITSDNADLLTDASVSATLSAGTYYLRVTSVGRGDILADGYSSYGSIGQYSISGNAP
jgi:hypothetical protein